MNTNVDAQNSAEVVVETTQADPTVADALVETLTETVSDLEVTPEDRETAELVGKLAVCLLENVSFIERISDRVVAKIAENFKKQQAAAIAQQQAMQAQQLPFSAIYDFNIRLEPTGSNEEVRLVVKEGFMENDDQTLLEVYAKEQDQEIELISQGLDPQIVVAIRDALREVNPIPGVNYYGEAEVKASVREQDEANRIAAEQEAAGNDSGNTDSTIDPADPTEATLGERLDDEVPEVTTEPDPVH